MNKKLVLFLMLSFFFLKSNYIFSQKNEIVELHNEYFKTSFVYSIESKAKSDFYVNIGKKGTKKELITKKHINLVGEKFFKIDVSSLKKGTYFFKVLDNLSNVIFVKKVKKI